jgi:hypothetical protein
VAGYSVTFSVVDEATKTLEAITRRIQQMRAPIERQQRQLARIIDSSGLKKVAEGFGEIGSAAGTAFSSLARIVPVLGTITGAASLAGMAKLAESTANFARALQLDSTYVNTTTQRLQTMQNGFRIAGGSADTMTESLKNVAKTSYDAFLGRNAVAAQRLRNLGIALRDNNGNLRNAVDLEGDEIDRISKITDARDRETVATELGGRALFDVVEQYRLAGKTRQEAEAEAAKYGALTKEQIDGLHQFHDALSEVNVAFSRLGEDMGAMLAPYFTPVLNWMSELVRNHKPAVIVALDAIGIAVTALGGLFALQIGIKAVGAVASLTTSVATLGLTITRALAPLAALFAAYEGAKSVIADPGNLAPGAGLWKSFQNIMKGKAPWAEGYFPTDKNPLAPPPAAGTPNAGPVLGGTPAPSPAGAPGAPAAPSPAGPVLDLGGNPAPATAAPPAGTTAPAPPSARGPGRMGGMRAPAPATAAAPTPASYTPPAGPTPAAATPAEGGAGEATPTSTANVAGPAKAGSLYQQRAGGIVADLETSLGLTRDQAAGLVGNLGYESAGFKSLQEGRPISGRGGLGYGQWTGSRRVDFEKWSAEQGLDPHSHAANVGFLKHELTGKYAGFLAHLKETQGIEAASRVTHKEFETPADVIPKYFGTRIGSRVVTPYMTGPDRLKYARQAAGLAAATPQQAAAPAARMPQQAAAPPQAAAPAAQMPPQASGAPAQVTGGPPVSGSVDVNITHRNPPPGASVTASAAGAGINLNPPRVEQQQLQNV